MVVAIVCKNYKPEILNCPICNSKLVYRHTVSDKLVYFTSGKRIRIKNLGYACPICNNQIYFSQTANKLCFKGYTYSAKVVCQIAFLKKSHFSREYICDYFFAKGIEMSERNVDNLYHKYLELEKTDGIALAESMMIAKYRQVRWSIDLITLDGGVNILVYDFFTGTMVGLKFFNSVEDDLLKAYLGSFLSPDKPISVIATIRKDQRFYPLLKSLCSPTTKFIAFNKF